MKTILLHLTPLTTEPKHIPDSIQYIFVVFLVMVLFLMKEEVNMGIYKNVKQLKDKQKN